MNIHTSSQSGSALLQAMIGIGLVGMMSYSVMNYQAYSNQENRAQFAQNEIDSTAQMVSALVAIPALCNSNVSLQNNFVRPANLNNPAADAPLAINLGLPTSDRPAWVDTTMGAAAGTSIPGTITAFNIRVNSLAVSGARLKRNISSTNQLWVGDIVLTAQKPNNFGTPATTGKRIVGSIELEIDAAGTKVNCSTSASVATICRDLGGVYDPLGVPNCVFAMKPMDCDSIPDGYVHDIDGSGNPVCRSATAVCPTGYFANGMTEGALNCTRLSRRIIYQAPPAMPPAPGPAAPPADCTSAVLNWTVGSNSCSATAPATLHTAAANVTDSVADATGTASFICNNGVWNTTPEPGATCTTPPPAPACVKVFLYSACKKAGGKTACGYASPHYLYPELACSGNIIAGGYNGPQGTSSRMGVGTIANDGWSIPPLKSYPTAKCVVHYKVGYSSPATANAMESIYYDGPAQPGALTTGKVNSVGVPLIQKADSCP